MNTPSKPDPEGHAQLLLSQFGDRKALHVARFNAELPSAGTYWARVLAALERLQPEGRT